jgi:cold shock CspA family protein
VKKFAFVKGEDGRDRMFMPSSLDLALRWEQLKKGDRLEFDDILHTKGLRAGNVRFVV